MHPHRGRGRGFYRNRTSPGSPVKMERLPGKSSAIHDNKCLCSSISIALTLEPVSEAFLLDLKSMWNLLKKSPPVINKLHQHLNNTTNPYLEVLRLMYNCQEFNMAKSKSLPFFIIEEFQQWLTLNQNHKAHLLTAELKIDSFKVISTQNSVALTKAVVETFQMGVDGEIFLDIIKCMIQKKKYKEACQSTILLKLQDRFGVEDFLLPMVLQDRLHGIDEFLLSSPRHQIELVAFLDSILGKPSVRDFLTAYALELGVPDMKWDKLHAKPLKKLIIRFTKTFRIPAELTPNLNRRRNEGALQFLLHKRYIEHGFSEESFKEMAQEAVRDDVELQRELVTQVAFHDVSEALRWAHFYHVEREYWPHNVRMLEENPDEKRLYQRNILQPEDNWDVDLQDRTTESIEYHKFSLPESAICLVNTELTFEAFLDTGLQDVDVVGIDCEWKPNFGSQQNELALMQLATRNKVFILDIIAIGNKVPHLWQELGKFLLNNCDILKLGFGFSSDMLMIKHSLPELNFTSKQVGFLDLLSLWKVLEKSRNIAFPHEVQVSGPSLSSLVHLCLGHPLDKSDQFSNWEKRPLRDTQLVYAALDAYVLIEIYDIVKNLCEKNHFPFDETCYNLMTNDKSAAKKKVKKPTKKVQQVPEENQQIQTPSPHSIEVPASAVRLVCDTMLQGLGKNLRRCGIDTVILDNNADHMECVRHAQDERRFVLTRGSVFHKLNGYVPSGHCLKVVSDNVDEQLSEVLSFYKINITKGDVFSVCQVCNSRSFIKISRSTLKALINVPKYKTSYYEEDCQEYDEATGFSSEEEFAEAPGPPTTNQTAKNWNLHTEENINMQECETRLGAKIQINTIPENVVDKTDYFYVCEECGKVYWDGTHFEKVLNGRLQGIVQ